MVEPRRSARLNGLKVVLYKLVENPTAPKEPPQPKSAPIPEKSQPGKKSHGRHQEKPRGRRRPSAVKDKKKEKEKQKQLQKEPAAKADEDSNVNKPKPPTKLPRPSITRVMPPKVTKRKPSKFRKVKRSKKNTSKAPLETTVAAPYRQRTGPLKIMRERWDLMNQGYTIVNGSVVYASSLWPASWGRGSKEDPSDKGVAKSGLPSKVKEKTVQGKDKAGESKDKADKGDEKSKPVTPPIASSASSDEDELYDSDESHEFVDTKDPNRFIRVHDMRRLFREGYDPQRGLSSQWVARPITSAECTETLHNDLLTIGERNRETPHICLTEVLDDFGDPAAMEEVLE